MRAKNATSRSVRKRGYAAPPVSGVTKRTATRSAIVESARATPKLKSSPEARSMDSGARRTLSLGSGARALVEMRRGRRRLLREARSALRLHRRFALLEHVLVVMREASRRAARLQELRERDQEIELAWAEGITELLQ